MDIDMLGTIGYGRQDSSDETSHSSGTTSLVSHRPSAFETIFGRSYFFICSFLSDNKDTRFALRSREIDRYVEVDLTLAFSHAFHQLRSRSVFLTNYTVMNALSHGDSHRKIRFFPEPTTSIPFHALRKGVFDYDSNTSRQR
jgi:hypothetical protein